MCLLQFKAKVSLLTGCIPAYRSAHSLADIAPPVRPTDLSAICSLAADGEILGLPSRTRPKEADLDGCEWQEWLRYCIKVPLTKKYPSSSLLLSTQQGWSRKSHPYHGLRHRKLTQLNSKLFVCLCHRNNMQLCLTSWYHLMLVHDSTLLILQSTVATLSA